MPTTIDFGYPVGRLITARGERLQIHRQGDSNLIRLQFVTFFGVYVNTIR